MRTEFSKLRDYWAEFFLCEFMDRDAPAGCMAEKAYEFADAMMEKAGYDPDSL